MESKPVRRVVVVDDESFTRSTSAQLLRQAGFEVAEASSAVAAKRAVADFDPDAMVIDIELGKGPTGLDLIAALNTTHRHIAFVLLSNFAPTPADLAELQNVAFVSKRQVTDFQQLIDALEYVLADHDPSRVYPATDSGKLAALTKNQIEILRLLASGATNQEISSQRRVSMRAVEKSIQRIYEALDIKRDGKTNPRQMAAQLYMGLAGKPSSDHTS